MKDIGHRQVYDILQGRKPRAAGSGLWGFRFSGDRPASGTAAGKHLGGPGYDDRGRVPASISTRIAA